MIASAKRVASLYLKLASDPATLFRLLASKNKTPFVQSVYQQFLAGRTLSARQKEIIDEIALKEGIGTIFSASSIQGLAILPVLTLNKNLGIDASLFRDAVKEMWGFVTQQDDALNSRNIEKPIWVKQYVDKRENVSRMNTDNDWANLKLMSFFSTDIHVLVDSKRNLEGRKLVNRLQGLLIELLDLLSKKRQPTIEIQHLITSLNVAVDDFRYRDDSNSIFLKNVAPSETDLQEYLVDLYIKYKEMVNILK